MQNDVIVTASKQLLTIQSIEPTGFLADFLSDVRGAFMTESPKSQIFSVVEVASASNILPVLRSLNQPGLRGT